VSVSVSVDVYVDNRGRVDVNVNEIV
jgi:hypothetical protein